MAKAGNKTRKKSADSKTVSKKSTAKKAAGPRLRNATKKQVKQKIKAEVRSRQSLTGSFRLTGRAFAFLRQNWKMLGKIVLVYALLNLIFANGLLSDASSAISSHRNFSDAVGGFSSIISGSGGSSQNATLQSILLVIESLAIIYTLRHLFAGEYITTKQAYYLSGAPLIPFLIILFFIVIQMLPLTIGAVVLALVSSVAGGLVEVVFSIIFGLLALWSIYMVCSSIFAIYIVTLPGMQPRQAIRSAKNLVHFRRWQVLRKLLFLPIFILIVMGIILVPLILVAHFLVPAVYFVLVMVAILYAHTYLYSLYKELLA